MIPQETVDLILDTARIEDVIGDFVTLKRRGASLVACCPFHNEKTPSFYVTPSKGIYKCFGCGKAGSAVGFVMEHEHCTYAEALRYIAKRYHIEVKESEESAEEIQARQRSESLHLVSEFAQKFFVDSLSTEEGRSHGYAYYHSRGMEDETIARFGLGWAPSGRTALTDAALAAGYKAEYLIAAGLSVRYDDGRLVDKFSERVMFPIHSLSGRVIAFSGRTLRTDKTVAKYVNTAETEIYHKSRALYGIYLAKSEISRQDKCILVEGNVDVVSMHQLGITNVLASCGTALTVEQVRLIHKFTDNVTIMYDGDGAGIHAAQRGIGLVLKEGLNVKVVLLPEGNDPDDFARKHSLEEVQDFIRDHEQDFVSFETDLLLAQAGNDPIKRANLINDIADTVALIPDAVKRSVYVNMVSQKFGIEDKILFSRITDTRKKMMEDERMAQVRAERRESAAAQDGDAPQGDAPAQEQPVPVKEPQRQIQTDRIVSPVEKEILVFLLTHGTDILEFESDSEMYDGGEKPTVADFILDSIDQDGGKLQTPAYQAVYEAYAEGYDAGYEQEQILRRLLDSEDRQTADIAAELSMEKYQLTVKDFQDALTTTSSWLVRYVPRTMMLYMEKKLEYQVDQLRRQMAATADMDEQLDIMRRIQELQATIKLVQSKKIR